MKIKSSWIYGRFSDDKQMDGDSERRQIELNTKCLKNNGVAILGQYFDRAVSAKDGKDWKTKKELSKLLNIVQPGQGICIENFDRFDRSHPWKSNHDILSLLERGISIITSSDGKEYT